MKTHEIAEILSGELVGDGQVEITSVADIDTAVEGDIAFLEKTEFTTRASCLIVSKSFAGKLPATSIIVDDPKLAFALIAEILHPPKQPRPEIHASAVISESARIGADVFVGAYTCVGEGSEIGNGTQLRAGAKIGDNVRVGRNCVFHPNVFVEDGCTIGDGVILHAGVVIGTDGFGYVRGPDAYIKFPQIGTVIIEDHVEIGANTCIDRGALGKTRIGEGTKIDNLVQIAHNVQIGKRVVIAAQTGISGSTVIEDDCVIGGQVGMGDHARVLSGAHRLQVCFRQTSARGLRGHPWQSPDEYKRQNAHLKGYRSNEK